MNHNTLHRLGHAALVIALGAASAAAAAATPATSAAAAPAAAASATSPTPAAPASPARKALLDKLLQLELPGVDKLARGVAGQTSGRMLQVAGQVMTQLPQERRAATAKAIQAEVDKFNADIEPLLRSRAAALAPSALLPLIDARFNDAELRQIIAWLESPVAKKFQQINPDLEAALVQKLVADTRATVEPKLAALQTNLQGQLVAAQKSASAVSPAASAAAPAAGPASKP